MTDGPNDRRNGLRAGFPGKAVVTRARPAQSAEFTIRDLSTSGARLIGRLQLAEGERITVALTIDGVALPLDALVVRTEPQSSQVAVAFCAVPTETLAAIEAAVGAMIKRVHASSPATVLVVCASPERAAELQRDLAQLGRAFRACATMLETMWALTEPTLRCEAVIIASHVEPEPLAELLKHLADHHPQLRRLLLFGDHLESIDHASSNRVDAVLRTPLRIRALARALGIRETDSSVGMLPVPEPK